jgi:hypothetical protein
MHLPWAEVRFVTTPVATRSSSGPTPRDSVSSTRRPTTPEDGSAHDHNHDPDSTAAGVKGQALRAAPAGLDPGSTTHTNPRSVRIDAAKGDEDR